MRESLPVYGTPKLADSHPDVFPGSPKALIGVMVDVLRLRFEGENALNLGYVWRPDPQPELTEENTDSAPTRILIEPQYLQDPDARDSLPALYVARGETPLTQVVVGNRMRHDIPTSAGEFMVHGTTPMSVMCVASKSGESETLADTVAFYLAASAPTLRATFGFQDFSLPNIGAAQVYRRSPSNIEEWVTTVTFQLKCKYIWREMPIAPRLQSIVMKMELQNRRVLDTELRR